MTLTINRLCIWVAMISVACGLAGCGKKPVDNSKAAAGDQAGVPHQNQGVPICEDALHDVVFIGPHTLPVGTIAPTGSLLGLAVGKANTILKTSDGGTTWRRVTARDTKGPDFKQIIFI